MLLEVTEARRGLPAASSEAGEPYHVLAEPDELRSGAAELIGAQWRSAGFVGPRQRPARLGRLRSGATELVEARQRSAGTLGLVKPLEASGGLVGDRRGKIGRGGVRRRSLSENSA